MVHEVQVVHVEVARLGIRSYYKVVHTLLEEPLLLPLLEKHAALFDFIELDNVAGLMGEFVLALVRNQNSFNRVDVKEP